MKQNSISNHVLKYCWIYNKVVIGGGRIMTKRMFHQRGSIYMSTPPREEDQFGGQDISPLVKLFIFLLSSCWKKRMVEIVALQFSNSRIQTKSMIREAVTWGATLKSSHFFLKVLPGSLPTNLEERWNLKVGAVDLKNHEAGRDWWGYLNKLNKIEILHLVVKASVDIDFYT